MGSVDSKGKYVKILEALAYIAARIPVGKKNYYNVLKVFYLADKDHMEQYGRFIFDDHYSAMDMGPVPSLAYDLVKAIRANESLPHSLVRTIKVVGYQVSNLRDADEDVFSGSDLECIDSVIELSKTQDIAKISHDDAWKQTGRNSRMSDSAIIGTLKYSNELLELHSNRHP